MRKKTNKKYGALYLKCGMIAVIAICMLIIFGSCNPEKRASKLFSKADNKSHITVLNKCSEIAPPISETRDSFIYKQGDPVVFQDTVTIHDTINGKEVVYITQKVKVTDTVYKTKEVTTVDRAKEYALQGQLKAEQDQHAKDNAAKDASIAKYKTEKQYWQYAALSLGGVIALIVIIWAVRLYWKVRKKALPI